MPRKKKNKQISYQYSIRNKKDIIHTFITISIGYVHQYIILTMEIIMEEENTR